MSRFLNVLRSWLVMVSVIAAGNTLQSFRDHGFLSEKLYTASPGLVNGLQARTFGVWTLLSSVIRCLCAIDIRNRTLYHITLFTFFLALAHFLSARSPPRARQQRAGPGRAGMAGAGAAGRRQQRRRAPSER